MKSSHLPDNITHDEILRLSILYKAPAGLETLDAARLTDIPSSLNQRQKSNDDGAYLEKTEVVKLMEWKLKHGKFRPRLTQLIASNTADDIKAITRAGFNLFDADPFKAIAKLSELKGVGPATASLLLSCYDQTRVPFFSDELFRWVHFDPNSTNSIEGWDRKIGYTMKEYKELFADVEALRGRVNQARDGGQDVTALDLEKTAWMLKLMDDGNHVDDDSDGASKEKSPETTKQTRKRKR